MVWGNLVQYLRFSKLQQAAYLSREWHPEQCLLKPFCDLSLRKIQQQLFSFPQNGSFYKILAVSFIHVKRGCSILLEF